MHLFDEDPLGLLDKRADVPSTPFDGPPVASSPLDPTKTAEPGRSFIDPVATRKAIYDRTLSQLSTLPPLTNQKYTLALRDVAYHDPENYSIKEQKQAVLEGRTLARRLRGTWALTDNATGQEVASKTSTLAHVPFYSPKGVFVLNGSQYSLASQLRLKPGVFTRLKENGELDSHVNVLPGQGVSHHVNFDPESGVFRLNISQANYPLYTVLKAMGAKDKDLQEAWGDLYYANAQKDDPGALNKLHAKLVRGANKAQDDVGRKQQIVDALIRMPMDPEVNQQTLGKPYANVSPEVYVDATKKLLALSRGEIDPDDRDHLAYMTVHGPEDLISERVLKDQSELRRALWKATLKGDLSAMPAGVFSKSMIAAITKSGLGQPLEQINPSMTIEQMGRISRMGLGGVPSVDSIPQEARTVQPSHLGYIDPIATPESMLAGVDSRLAYTARKGSDGRLYSKFIDAKTGKTKYLHPGDLLNANVAFPAELSQDKPYVAAMSRGRITYVPRDEVDYTMPSMEDAFGPLANLIPMKSAIKGQRLAMGSRMSNSGSTVIYVLRRGGDLYRGPIEDYVWREGDRSPSVDKETGVVEWKPVRDKITHENVLRMFRVNLKSGRYVEATADHSFVTLGDDGSLVKIATQDLKPGAPIPYLGHLRIPSGLTLIDWVVPAGNKHNARPETSFTLDFDLGWMHGVYAAEGNVVTSKRDRNRGDISICLAALTPEIRHKLIAFFDRYGVTAAERRGRPDKKIDRVVVNWRQLGGCLGHDFGRGAYNKKLPDWVFAAPEAYRRGLIAGYLAGDGIVARHRAQVAVSGGSRSVLLRDMLCELLATLGVDTTRYELEVDTGPKHSRVTQHYFRVRSDHVHKLPLTSHPRKDKLLQACKWSGRRASDWLPMYPTLKRQLVAVTARGSSQRCSVYADQVTKTKAAGLLETVTDPRMHRWIKSDVRWDKVESITELDASLYPLVYDLDMEDNVFACQGGVFVHNTTQALPLVGAEAPLVQSGVPGDADESYEERYGTHMGAVRAESDGWVKSVSPDAVEVELPDKSTRTYELAVHEPSNRKTGLNQTPVVQVGQRVTPNMLLARSNYTNDQGATALGRNVRVAMLPGFGENSNYEDAWVISRSAADKFRSEHYYQHEAADEDGLSLGKQTFVSAFPGKFPKATLDNFDADGVIRPGTEVKPGDPLILAVKQREANRSQVYRGHGPSYVDKSETWDHHDPGVVTDAVRTKDGVRVVVRTESSAEVGDKLCLSADHDVLTLNRSWVPIEDVTLDDKVACLRDGRLRYARPTALHRYETGGLMYHIRTQQIDLLATANHRMYVQPKGKSDFELIPASELFGENVRYKKDAEWAGKTPESFELPGYTMRCGQGGVATKAVTGRAIATRVFVKLLGAYLSEGNPFKSRRGSGIMIHQTTPKGRAWFEEHLLPELESAGFHCVPTKGKYWFYSKHLYEYFVRFGKCYDKYIPAEVFTYDKDTLNDLFLWLMWGDGCTGTRPINYTTTSPRLADNVQQLCLHIGKSANVHCQITDGPVWINGRWSKAAPRYTVRIINSILRPSVNHRRTKPGVTQVEEWIENYQEPVYCLTVPGEVFYVRRNGKPVFSANSNRMGGKGLIGAIVPDHLMPQDEEGRPTELLFNPAGVISRCYDDQTEFLTEAGWKFGKDVLESDRLYCFDKWTGAVRWCDQIASMHSERYTGEMVGARHDHVDFLVTPNHKMYAMALYGDEPDVPNKVCFLETTAEKLYGESCGLPQVQFDDPVRSDCVAYIGVREGDWYRTPYDGMVYCPSVETGYVVVRRCGKTVCSGNTNPAAAFEFALGKIAEKTGQPYKIKDFDKIEDLAQFTMDEMEKHGVKDFGHVTDPRTGRKINGVTTGNAFFMKLHHTSSGKHHGRGTGGYSAEGQPARGTGTTSAKRLALMSLNALLSSGSTNVIRDGLVVRGQANPHYWLQFMSGHTPPTPEVPHVHQKFFNQLKAAGVNVTREGTKFRVKALRNQDIDELAEGRIIRNPETVSWKEGLAPIKGGLFDEALTGGHGGKKWSSLALTEPMPSPVFEEPIRRLLNLTKQQYRDVLAGKRPLGDSTGPGAIKNALSRLDVDKAIAVARADVASGKKTSRDAAVRRLGYLKSAQKDGIHPKDWIWDKVPVLPPIFRPVSIMQANKKPLVADVNVLYKELMDADSNLKDVSGRIDDVGPERLAVYDALKAVTGLDDSIHPKTVQQGVKGLLAEIHGGSPKFGAMQRKLLSSPVDLVGRAVIVPNPDLDIDSVGIPEAHAWEVYKPFIVRRLVRRGMKHGRAVEEVTNRTNHARDAMLDEMKTRPVILDRAPVLHRYGVMAFWPRLVKGDSIHLTPLVTAGYGADFDGDQMNYQVPASDEAVRDAVEKMLPSKNLLATSNFQVHQTPTREFAAGLWLATKDDKDDDRKPQVFKTKRDAINAYRNGEIDVDQPVHILSE